MASNILSNESPTENQSQNNVQIPKNYFYLLLALIVVLLLYIFMREMGIQRQL